MTNKTQANNQSVKDFLNSIENKDRKADSFKLLSIMESITGDKAVMWGSSIIGFGDWHYKYASGREGNWFRVGFSPRKNAISLYTNNYFEGISDAMKNLGKYKTGKSCIYIKSMDDIDKNVLNDLLRRAYEQNGS
ncbi:MAG: DUF1801 domain-containing protein [Bacteroidales bacterium]|jgi:hypothetical protein|nr:DUF1801 domain-containing protein [Bacteroidales bacterium]